MTFEPHIFGPSPFGQVFITAAYELIVNTVFPEKFVRETFKLPDGGTLGLEWDGGIPDMENE